MKFYSRPIWTYKNWIFFSINKSNYLKLINSLQNQKCTYFKME